MPNWCSNVVRLSKDGFDFSEIEKRMKKDGLYGQFLPAPEGLNDAQLTNWCYVTWGVKWDVMNAECNIDGNTMTLNFDSPWAPPREWLSYMVSIGYDVQGVFWEPGMAMGGAYTTLHDGSLVAPTLQWEQDDLVVKGSPMYELLSSYDLIWDDEWEEAVE
jgi:hypothetical protein